MNNKEWMERALCAEEALMELWDQYKKQEWLFGNTHRWTDKEDEAAIKNAEKQVEWIRRDWNEH